MTTPHTHLNQTRKICFDSQFQRISVHHGREGMVVNVCVYGKAPHILEAQKATSGQVINVKAPCTFRP